ncbi:MAG: 50S ribosomal protein L20 [Deltaproteobacteria bacterium]|nr:50S ribosomal protein L20 [Deltaproteobacteria bacterium]
MPRVKRGTKARRRRKKILKLASGAYNRRHSSIRRGTETVERGWVYAYRDRKVKKRMFRSLWIQRINAAVRPFALTYSEFISKVQNANIGLNRKMLSELSIRDPKAFETLVRQVSS